MCLAMNPDKLIGDELCASSSNRNFKGRQGIYHRPHRAHEPGHGRRRRRHRRRPRTPARSSRRSRNP